METDNSKNSMRKGVERSRVTIDNFNVTAFDIARLWGEQARLYTLNNLLYYVRNV